jgi:hypothetical protein
MRGTGIEKEVAICATNITNKTKCMGIIAKKSCGLYTIVRTLQNLRLVRFKVTPFIQSNAVLVLR